MKELVDIQSRLKAGKSQVNKFGGYNYRSCEDILEAVKPLLEEHSCIVNLTDELVYVGEKFFVKSTAVITNSSAEKVATVGFAGHALEKKGMDFSQITGAASSYARKYALNGLFAIDDAKDSDSTNTHGNESRPKKPAAKKPAPKKEEKPFDVEDFKKRVEAETSVDKLRELYKEAPDADLKAFVSTRVTKLNEAK